MKHHAMRHDAAEPTYTDPVCGMKLSRNTAAEELAHDGRTYYFCARVCREAFEADPDRYVRRHRQRGMDGL